jgi:long-subunit acyl-CoA synthetase (AMP-forming)
MTETATVVTSSSEDDVFTRGSGSLIAGAKGKIIDLGGKEITEHDKPGELLIQAPSVVLGYLNNEKATSETFVHHNDGRWIRTGDEALVTLAPSGYEHVVIVDRIKELIKVKVGHCATDYSGTTLTVSRVIKLHLRNSRPIFSHIRMCLTVP